SGLHDRSEELLDLLVEGVVQLGVSGVSRELIPLTAVQDLLTLVTEKVGALHEYAVASETGGVERHDDVLSGGGCEVISPRSQYLFYRERCVSRGEAVTHVTGVTGVRSETVSRGSSRCHAAS